MGVVLLQIKDDCWNLFNFYYFVIEEISQGKPYSEIPTEIVTPLFNLIRRVTQELEVSIYQCFVPIIYRYWFEKERNEKDIQNLFNNSDLFFKNRYNLLSWCETRICFTLDGK